MALMALVFLSHAFADRALVDEFEETVLRNGCGLDSKEIFYSSGADNGVPDGSDLLAYVREKVEETGLVVAMLTPTFQTRPVCVAELGAAWARTGSLFPLLVPGMQRSTLEGVLSTQLVESMDSEAALDRLHDRVVEISGRGVDAATWTRFKQKWLRRLGEIIEAGGVPTPPAISVDDHKNLMEKCDELAAALAVVENENERLRRELDAVSKLKDKGEVASALLPTVDVERFEALVAEARDALGNIDNRWIREAIVAEFSDQGAMALPADPYYQEEVHEAATAGYLDADDDGYFWASDAFPAHEEARQAVGRAIGSASDTEDFEIWFAGEHDAYPRLKKLSILRSVFID